jgi:hypothetical protein
VVTQEKVIPGLPENAGLSEHDLLRIHISMESKSERMPESAIADTVLHEILHCIDVVCLGNVLEEKTICQLAAALLAVIRDNNIDFLNTEEETKDDLEISRAKDLLSALTGR